MGPTSVNPNSPPLQYRLIVVVECFWL